MLPLDFGGFGSGTEAAVSRPVPSMLHEALVALFSKRLELAPELLRDALGVALPAWETVRRETGDLTQVTPTEYRADLVMVLEGARVAVVVEVQLRRDDTKRASWPVYLATLRARLGCAVILLVVAPSPAVARWAGAPIELGHPGFRLVPLVLSPELVPAITSADDARASPELAVLSAIVHGRRGSADHAIAIATAALEAAALLDDERARLYADLVLGGLAPTARRALEALMTSGKYEYQSSFARRYFGQGRAEGKAEGRAEGKAEGKADALLVLLTARGLMPSDAERARIRGEQDLARLDRWIERALDATSVAEILGVDDAS